ncbi:MAG: SGNH/GDSL hydrolase family protein [Anaerolineae bacterium]|nr:SGNH/GDSL hydrolase family protein [Thermoflexales bacterium]MDW8406401.1 SGNH/GDSL hydrolase family protein [Anaerolineae bacterium]
MNNRTMRLLALGGFVAMLCAAPVVPAHAQSNQAPQFAIVTPGAYLRQQPTLLSANTYPVFKGDRFEIVGRTADNIWLQLSYPNAISGTWIIASLGEVIGELKSVKPLPANKMPPPVPPGRPGPITVPGTPVITAAQKALYRKAIAAGRDATMFAVIGDCNSQPTAYVGRLAAGLFGYEQYRAYPATVARFTRAFARVSLAAAGGFNSAAVLDPTWADPYFCKAGESPLACELRMSKASIAFIELGTGDTHIWRDFEANFRAVVETTLKSNVLPVLITKADALEYQQADAPEEYINNVIRKVGAEYGVPVMDFWKATRDLPNYGLLDEGNADFHLGPGGSYIHLLQTVQVLDQIWR